MKRMYACSYRYGVSIALVAISKETKLTVTIAGVDKEIIGNCYLWPGNRKSINSLALFNTWPEVQAWLHDTIGSISDRIAQEQARLQELIELVDKKEEEL